MKMDRRDYLPPRLFKSGFENVNQNNAPPIAQSTEQRPMTKSTQATVSVPSDRIVSTAHNDNGVAQSSWNKTTWPLSEELHHLKNLFLNTKASSVTSALSESLKITSAVE
jgi:hypothetical protein